MNKMLSHRDVEYDTLRPEETLRSFVKFLKDVKARYDFAVDELERCERETQDILHYIELGDNLNAMKGFKAYKSLSEIRRRRRIYKNELELLKPVYQYLLNQDPKLADRLAQVQGDCRKGKEKIELRSYTCKTDILEECT